MAKPSTTVRISVETRDFLNKLKKTGGFPDIESVMIHLVQREHDNAALLLQMATHAVISFSVLKEVGTSVAAQHDIIESLDAADVSATAVRLIEETRHRIGVEHRRRIEAQERANMPPVPKNMEGVVDLASARPKLRREQDEPENISA